MYMRSINSQSLHNVVCIYGIAFVSHLPYENWDRCTMSINSVAKLLCFLFRIENDWTFDEQISGMYGCEVHSFDPRWVSYVLIYGGGGR